MERIRVAAGGAPETEVSSLAGKGSTNNGIARAVGSAAHTPEQRSELRRFCALAPRGTGPVQDIKDPGDPSSSFLYDRVAVSYGYVKRGESLDLHIYGRGLDALEKKKYQRNVVSLSLNYLTLESLLLDKSFCQNLGKVFRLTEAEKSCMSRSDADQFQSLKSVRLSHNGLMRGVPESLSHLQRFLALLAGGHPELEDFSIDCGERNNDQVDMGSPSSATRLYYRAAIVSKLPKLDLLDNKEVSAFERQLADVIKGSREISNSLEPFDGVLAPVRRRCAENVVQPERIPLTESLEFFDTHLEKLIRDYLESVWEEILADNELLIISSQRLKTNK
ncbi:hypothetical protein FOZ61_002090 [Perkinsus olseni]|uniref:Uncharacterized protein n=1 Tax=Perkinsus olseni TaxID=32597 RepID=A0A7J6KW87_PEROL|nr:hypothetical protein FOL46_000283 [Perkinsus olseni]KAF4662884.1 hypothetical protein FOZ61_002090 [Perkinsus olseni]